MFFEIIAPHRPAIPVDTPSPAIPKTPKPITPCEELPAQEESSGGLFGWMKDTVGLQGQSILSKVAEKAKHSVDTMITTLDPQMREFMGKNCLKLHAAVYTRSTQVLILWTLILILL